MSALHPDRLAVELVVGEWILSKSWLDRNVIEIRHYHKKSDLTWQTQPIEPGISVCETCVEPVPPGVIFMSRTLKLQRAVELT